MSMRVTNKMLSNNFLTDMRTNMKNLQTIQKQMATQKEINVASDDPIKAARIMELNTSISSNLQYNLNIKEVDSFLDTTDSALGQFGNVLNRFRDLLIQSGNGSYVQQEKNALKDEINTRIGELSQALNTNYDGKYIFAGTRVDDKPVATINNKVASNGMVVNSKNNGGNPLPGDSIATVTGTLPIGQPDTIFKVTVLNAPAASPAIPVVNSVNIQTSTDGGKTFSAATTAFLTVGPPASFAVPNLNDPTSILIPPATVPSGMTIRIPDDYNNHQNDTYTFASTAANVLDNTKLIYNSGDPLAPELVVNSQLASNIGNGKISQINEKLSVDISQGINIQYSVSATDVIQFKNPKGINIDLRQVLTSIVNHLDGKNSDGTAIDATATQKLNSEDLSDLTDVINNVLSLRSKVGANQNRMAAAKDRNETENSNLTEMISKVQDIDITQKTIDYSGAQTVYTAALQTSAKIIQPSLLDYLR